ncbi:MAG: hypothetical protein EBS07_11165 [Sphingobacteriia bacterium]|nr:hypothetical protein [Sphingobacteriia bacterium]
MAVQWLNLPSLSLRQARQAVCFYQSLCLVDPASAGLRNRHLRKAAKRYAQYFKDSKEILSLKFRLLDI